MHMVRLFHLHVVLWELVHDLSQIAVHSREDGHTDGEVRGPEECLALTAGLAHLVAVLRHPTRRAAHYLHTFCPGFQIVAVGRLRGGKLNGHIGRCKLRALKVLLIINVYDTHDFMTTVDGNLLNHLTHLSVAD